jgi:aminopeptidase-like protein
VGGIDWSLVPSEDAAGREMYDLMRELYPICRSISGDGVRRTLDIISRHAPLEVTEVPTGTQVFDWTVPREWNIEAAWIADADGERIIDFADCNLHVLGYSSPIHATLPLSELRDHLFTHPTNPDWIPFRTSYYNENWGFCLSQRQLERLDKDAFYEVCIDSSLSDGSITYGECHIEGGDEAEILLSTYACHPSLCNDNLSGVVLLALLGKYLRRMSLRHSCRLLFSPGSIGPISWLARNEGRLDRIAHGLVASCVGDPGGLTYKRSRRGDAEVDRAVATVLRDSQKEHTILDFTPLGGDERQFCSPGIDLPVGALSRTPADAFPEYHSSADNFDLVQPKWLGESFGIYLRVLDVLETNHVYLNQNPKGEPQLGKRGLYRSIGGGSSEEAALLWVLNLSDGTHGLLDIAERSGLPFVAVRDAAAALEEHDLLVRTDERALGGQA